MRYETIIAAAALCAAAATRPAAAQQSSVDGHFNYARGTQSSTDPEYQYIVGSLLELESQSPLSLPFEVRPGYVRGQEHTVMGRFDVTTSL